MEAESRPNPLGAHVEDIGGVDGEQRLCPAKDDGEHVERHSAQQHLALPDELHTLPDHCYAHGPALALERARAKEVEQERARGDQRQGARRRRR